MNRLVIFIFASRKIDPIKTPKINKGMIIGVSTIIIPQSHLLFYYYLFNNEETGAFYI